MNLVDLPIEMVDNILSYVSYEEVAKLRSVNRFFNKLCSYRLNQGFLQFEKFHNRCLKDIKGKLPRRESERKSHPLSRHSDILMAVESRLSMLTMTFSKYIECGQCCFIPGKVLDEAMRLLRVVNHSYNVPIGSTPTVPILPRPHEFMQEFRDISSMAMEYFDEKILPEVRDKMKNDNHVLNSYKSCCTTSMLPLYKLVKCVQINRRSCNITKKVIKELIVKMNTMANTINSYQRKTSMDNLRNRLRKTRMLAATTSGRSKTIRQPKTTVYNLNNSLKNPRKRLAATAPGCSQTKLSARGQLLGIEKQKRKTLTISMTSSISIPPWNENVCEPQGISSTSILVTSQHPSLLLNQGTSSSEVMSVVGESWAVPEESPPPIRNSTDV